MPGYKYFEDYTIGQKQTTSGRTMTEADIRLFIGCSDNTHPVHVDAQYCERHPSVTGCILQGDLILGVADGFFAKEITPSKVPSIHYGMDKVRFVKPTYPGDTVHCETEVVGQDINSYPSFFSRSFFQINENLTIAVTDMIMLGLSAVGILVLMYILYKTRMGISIRALSMDSDTAKLMGINVSFVMALTFFISGMLAAIAGVLCGMKFLLYPQLKDLVMKGMTASILGGLGNISGALYGGLLLGLLEVFMTNFVGSSLQPACTFLFAIIFLIFRPQGISGKFVKEKV